jgi:putative NIF3 family GTP cyclohydrolase 1 type 2
VPETRLEMVLPRERRPDVVTALRAAHPYEEPAFDVLELAPFEARRGLGRVGVLPDAEPLEDFAARVVAALPPTVGGVRVAGEPATPVSRVAVCGGAGDSLLDAAAHADVDVYVTADLRHHPASEALEAGGPALVDVSHWASEWPWLVQAARLLRDDLAGTGTMDDEHSLTLRVSDLCTDPWTTHAESDPADTETAKA